MGNRIPGVTQKSGEVNSSFISRKAQEKRTGRRLKLWTDGAPCTLCGIPMHKDNLNPDPVKREIEETWGTCYECRVAALGKLDRESGAASHR